MVSSISHCLFDDVADRAVAVFIGGVGELCILASLVPTEEVRLLVMFGRALSRRARKCLRAVRSHSHVTPSITLSLAAQRC